MNVTAKSFSKDVFLFHQNHRIYVYKGWVNLYSHLQSIINERSLSLHNYLPWDTCLTLTLILGPSPLRRRNLKTGFTLKTHQMFSVHTIPENIKDATTGHFGFLVEDTIKYKHMTSRQPYWCCKTMKLRPCWCTNQSWGSSTLFLCKHFLFFQFICMAAGNVSPYALLLRCHLFQKAPLSKYFLPTLKREAGIFKFFQFEERFRKALFSWRFSMAAGLTVETKLRFQISPVLRAF